MGKAAFSPHSTMHVKYVVFMLFTLCPALKFTEMLSCPVRRPILRTLCVERENRSRNRNYW